MTGRWIIRKIMHTRGGDAVTTRSVHYFSILHLCLYYGCYTLTHRSDDIFQGIRPFFLFKSIIKINERERERDVQHDSLDTDQLDLFMYLEWFWFYLLFMLLFIYLCYCCIYCIYIDALATLCYAVMLIKLIWIELNWNWIEREREINVTSVSQWSAAMSIVRLLSSFSSRTAPLLLHRLWEVI